MGLLGIILTATLRLRPIETTYFHQESIRAANLEAMLAALDENDTLFPYSVATLDVFATGPHLGRGVLTVGDHARLADFPPKLARHPLRISGKPKLIIPFNLPGPTLKPLTVRLVNAAIQGRPAPHPSATTSSSATPSTKSPTGTAATAAAASPNTSSSSPSRTASPTCAASSPPSSPPANSPS